MILNSFFFRRETNHYEPQPLTHGSLARLPDWSCAETGLPGSPTAQQMLQRQDSLELVKSIYEATVTHIPYSMLVDSISQERSLPHS